MMLTSQSIEKEMERGTEFKEDALSIVLSSTYNYVEIGKTS